MRSRQLVQLLSACVSLCCLLADGVGRYSAVSQKLNWAEAQSYCRAKFTDLITIQDAASNAAARQVVRERNFWIGLFNTSWRWSLGNEDVPLNSSFTRWAPGEPGPGSCVTVSASGLWSVRNCGLTYRFFCYHASADAHILVQTPMTRSDAQGFCRSNYTDMSSIKTAKDNTQISSQLQQGQLWTQPWPTAGSTAGSTVTGRASSTTGSASGTSPAEAWVGMYRFVWGWSDRSASTYSQWGPNQPSVSMNCAAMDESANWVSQPCDYSFSFLCYMNKSRMEVKRVKLRLSGGAADPNDLGLRVSLQQQLQQELQDGGVSEAMLGWRRQPDGNVFHREEEERAPPSVCGVKDV